MCPFFLLKDTSQWQHASADRPCRRNSAALFALKDVGGKESGGAGGGGEGRPGGGALLALVGATSMFLFPVTRDATSEIDFQPNRGGYLSCGWTSNLLIQTSKRHISQGGETRRPRGRELLRGEVSIGRKNPDAIPPLRQAIARRADKGSCVPILSGCRGVKGWGHARLIAPLRLIQGVGQTAPGRTLKVKL